MLGEPRVARAAIGANQAAGGYLPSHEALELFARLIGHLVEAKIGPLVLEQLSVMMKPHSAQTE